MMICCSKFKKLIKKIIEGKLLSVVLTTDRRIDTGLTTELILRPAFFEKVGIEQEWDIMVFCPFCGKRLI